MTDHEKRWAATLRDVAHVLNDDTPETEQHVKEQNESGLWSDMNVCDPDFARQLERQVRTFREIIRQLRERLMTLECASEESDEIEADLRTQLTRVTAQRDGLREALILSESTITLLMEPIPGTDTTDLLRAIRAALESAKEGGEG